MAPARRSFGGNYGYMLSPWRRFVVSAAQQEFNQAFDERNYACSCIVSSCHIQFVNSAVFCSCCSRPPSSTHKRPPRRPQGRIRSALIGFGRRPAASMTVSALPSYRRSIRLTMRARSVLTGNHSGSIRCQNGTRTLSSAFLFIGESIRSPLSATNGIHETCFGKDRRSISTTLRHTDCWTSSAIRTSYPCSRPSVSTRLGGRSYSKRRAQNTLYLSQSITMVLRCTTAD